MSIVFCGICPHPPIMVPEVGGVRSDEVRESRQAMLELGRLILESGAELMVMITPHGPVFRDGIAVNINPGLKGNLGGFGAPKVSFDLENEVLFASEIRLTAGEFGVMAIDLDQKAAKQYGVGIELDHGLMVPLYFLRQAGVNLPLVVIYMGLLPSEQLYKFGLAVQRAANSLGKKTAVLASGDLSHCLTPDAPAGYEPRGREFDREMVRLINAADVMGVIDLDSELVEKAGECGLRPIIMALGALDGMAVDARVLSYEGPFGVGYLVAAISPVGKAEERDFSSQLEQRHKEKVAFRNSAEGYLPGIARKALVNYLTAGKKIEADDFKIPQDFSGPAGVFVSLKKHGQLRGCIGTVSPQYENVVEETINNAISAGVRDPRFYPVRPEELDDIEISVDVLQAPEPIKGMDELDPERYGVIVKSGRRYGLLLPNLEGIDTPQEQVSIAREKAGIEPGETVELERFEVIRYK